MNQIAEAKNELIGVLNSDSLPIFVVISFVIAIILLIVGIVLKGKSKGKSTAAWVCIGIGSLAIISNGIQLIMWLA